MAGRRFDDFDPPHVRLPDVVDPPSDYAEDPNDAAALGETPPAGTPTNPGKRRGIWVPPAEPLPERTPPDRAGWTRLDGWIHYGITFLVAFLGAAAACLVFRR